MVRNATADGRRARRVAGLARRAVTAALAALLSGCAVGGYQPVASNQPIERQALAPEHRIFYDALEDQGRWTLIEPWGWVFKPDVNPVAWSPYQDGFWVPSDVYGWVWISNEPFGWAVYHYGQWAWDEFQGWVWIPGLEWGPGWVSWEMAASYVGWAPLMPSGVNAANIPGGPWRWAPTATLGTPALRERVVTSAQLGATAREARPVQNFATADGVTFNRGPAFEVVERVAGPLAKVRVDAVDPLAGVRERRGAAAAGDEELHRARVEATRRAAEEAARRAAAILSGGAPIAGAVRVVRPGFAPRPEEQAPGARGAGRRGAPASKSAAADSAARPR